MFFLNRLTWVLSSGPTMWLFGLITIYFRAYFATGNFPEYESPVYIGGLHRTIVEWLLPISIYGTGFSIILFFILYFKDKKSSLKMIGFYLFMNIFILLFILSFDPFDILAWFLD